MSQDKHGHQRLRVNVSATGPTAAKFWDSTRTQLGNVKSLDLVNAQVVPIVAFTEIRSMAGLWGITAELRHAVVDSMASAECPDMA